MYARKSQDQKDLQATLDVCQRAADLIEDMRKNYNWGSDKEELFENAFPGYELSVRANREMYRLCGDETFLEQAFAAFENSKSILLLETMQEAKAKSFYGLPDSLLNREYDLSDSLAYFEKLLFEEGEKRQMADSSTMALSQDKLFHLKQSRDSLLLTFERDYPDYYQFKHRLATVGIKTVQDQILQPEQALLEYFSGDSSLYVFLITKDQYDLVEIPNDFPMEDWVGEMQRNLYTYHLSGSHSAQQYAASADSLTTIAHQIYLKIFAPVLAKHALPEELIIVPDGPLAYLPFELLLRELPDDPQQFSSHAYLLRDYQISYCYSATLLREMQARRRPDEAAGYFLAFAPSFESDESVLASRNRDIVQIRRDLGPLQFNISEAENLRQLLGGDIFTGPSATEEQFLRIAPAYRIIHLATHGKANDYTGDYSFLAFAETPDSVENELLYTRDLYNMRLHADMVVLSACETGLGELQRGEGVISLARGFSYAGAKSIITTLWSINDATTTELMKNFYRYIKKGKTKDAALRQAKLDFLQSHPNDETHPFYWGAFIAVGDMEALSSGHMDYRLWFLLALGLIGGVFVFRRRKRGNF